MSELMRARAIVFVCALTGCGNPSSSGTDAAEAQVEVDAIVGEICNGIDDTQDGLVDEACPCTPFDVSLPSDLNSPSIVWTGADYLVVVDDRGTLSIASVNHGGFSASFNVGAVLDVYGVDVHDMAWSGSTLAVVSITSITPTLVSELAIFDAAGMELQRHVLPSEGAWQQIAWAGDRFVVTARLDTAYPEPLAFAEYASDGTPLTPATRVAATSSFGYPAEFHSIDAIAASSTKYVVVGKFYGDTRATVIDRGSHAALTHELLLGRTADWVSITHSGHLFAAVRGGGGGLTGGDGLQLLDANGAPQMPYSLPWTSHTATVAPATNGFVAMGVLADTTTTNQYASVRLDRIGVPIEPPVLPIALTNATGAGTRIDGATAHGRLAFANGYTSNTLRVIQRCD